MILQTSGPTPNDTSVTFHAGESRNIVILHSAAERYMFAQITFPSTTFADSGHDVTVRVKFREGVYGFDLETSSPIGGGATVTFMYSRFFAMPPEARRFYGSDVAFERALSVGILEEDSVLRLLPSTRPAIDNLQAPLPASGSYFVAAPQ